jgi:DNA polymerase-3 subunit epsilon
MSKDICIKQAQKWIEAQGIYLDTETTGLGGKDQIVQIAIVDHDGKVLIDTLVKPTIEIPLGATAIHGITNKDVAGAPSWRDIYQRVRGLMHGRCVVIYNASYDLQMIRQSSAAYGLDFDCDVNPPMVALFQCAMLVYAEYYGEWNDYRESWKWQRLENACHQQGIDVSDITAHQAAGDCEMTRRLVRAMSESVAVNV